MEDLRGKYEEAPYAYFQMLEPEQVWILRQRAQLMGRPERIFLELVLERGSSFRQIAHLTGQPESSVRRRFRKLIGRLVSKETLAAIRHPRLSPIERSVARAYYLEGLSQEAIARKTGSTPYFVRKTIEHIRALTRKETANTPACQTSRLTRQSDLTRVSARPE